MPVLRGREFQGNAFASVPRLGMFASRPNHSNRTLARSADESTAVALLANFTNW